MGSHLKRSILCLLASGVLISVPGMSHAGDYFKSLRQIMRAPPDAVPVLPAGADERRRFHELLKRSEAELRKDADYHGPDAADLHMSANGDFGGYGEAYKLYKGDFRNENAEEYAWFQWAAPWA